MYYRDPSKLKMLMSCEVYFGPDALRVFQLKRQSKWHSGGGSGRLYYYIETQKMVFFMLWWPWPHWLPFDGPGRFVFVPVLVSRFCVSGLAPSGGSVLAGGLEAWPLGLLIGCTWWKGTKADFLSLLTLFLPGQLTSNLLLLLTWVLSWIKLWVKMQVLCGPPFNVTA